MRSALRLVHDGGSLGDAVHRCTGVGKCVAPSTNGVMCPSYLATRDEKDATRGRPRVLQEALDGSLVKGLADPAVGEALDLCLACKGCASDCPTGVDMATYKAEALHQKHDVEGVRRPRSHYLLGRLPAVGRPGRTGRAAGQPDDAARPGRPAGPGHRGHRPAALDPGVRAHHAAEVGAGDRRQAPDVWIWADSFSDHFFPGNGHAAIRYLESVGLSARVIPDDACCGLTWITTGQLDKARAIMERTVRDAAAVRRVRGAGGRAGAVLPGHAAQRRGRADGRDARRAQPGRADHRARPCRCRTSPGSRSSPSRTATTTRCIGWAADQALLEHAGATVTRVAGCCGLAGNFGMEKGHYEVSVAVAETHLLPAVRGNPGAVVLADGMSCRVQLDDLADVQALHLAELLAGAASGAST